MRALVVVVFAALLCTALAGGPADATKRAKDDSLLAAVKQVAKPSQSSSSSLPAQDSIEFKAGDSTITAYFEPTVVDDFATYSVVLFAGDTKQPIYRRIVGEVTNEKFFTPTTKKSALNNPNHIKAAVAGATKDPKLNPEAAKALTASLEALTTALTSKRPSGPEKGKGAEPNIAQTDKDLELQKKLDDKLGISRPENPTGPEQLLVKNLPSSLKTGGKDALLASKLPSLPRAVSAPALIEVMKRGRRSRTGISSSSSSSSDSSGRSSDSSGSGSVASSGSSSGSSSDSGRSVDHTTDPNRPMRHNGPAVGAAADVYFGYWECTGAAFGTIGQALGWQHSATRVVSYEVGTNALIDTADYSNHGRACGDAGIVFAPCSPAGNPPHVGQQVPAANVPARWTCTTPYFVHVCNSDSRFQETIVRNPNNVPSTWRGMCARVYFTAPGCV